MVPSLGLFLGGRGQPHIAAVLSDPPGIIATHSGHITAQSPRGLTAEKHQGDPEAALDPTEPRLGFPSLLYILSGPLALRVRRVSEQSVGFWPHASEIRVPEIVFQIPLVGSLG